MSELIINSDSNCPRDEWFAMPAEDMKWLAFGLYPPGDFADLASENEDDVCDRLAEIDAAADAETTPVSTPEWKYIGATVGYGYRVPCQHKRVTESGFGTAWCAECDAKLRRNATSWEWELIK